MLRADTGPDLASATVLLAGTASYQTSLPDVPSVDTTLTDLRRVFVERCRAPAEAVRVARDLSTPMDLGDVVAEVAESCTGPLLFYYVGHGVVSFSNRLYLATARTERDHRVEHTGLAYDTVRQYLRHGPGRPVVVILDCCFSGRAHDSLAASPDEVADLASISDTGAFVLTSAGREEVALAPPGERHTAFSGGLIALLEQGDASPDAPAQITLDWAYRHLARTLPAAGYPRPKVRYTGTAGGLVLAANAGYRPKSAPPDRTRARRPAGASGVCPYKGLSAFDEADSPWFFGRERLTDILVRRLADRYDDPMPQVVSGVSGAGKSSLLRAGLLAALRRGNLEVPGSAGWPQLVLTPTADPMRALADRVAALCADRGVACEPHGRLASRLTNEPTYLRTVFREAVGGDRRARVVVIVDQLEELFTLCDRPELQAAFIAALVEACQSDDASALVVLSVRADFYGQCATFPRLVRALEQHPVMVDAMTATELRAIIERPAAAADLEIGPGVVDLLLADLGAVGRRGTSIRPHVAGRLPLLSHALLMTWQQREGSRLTVEAYRATGGIRGSLAATADQVLSGMDPATQRTAQRVLRRLVHVGEDSDDTRRRVDRAQLMAELPEPARVGKVLEAFGAPNARLITASDSTVELTHEALLHAWPTLRSWIETDRAGMLVEQQLVDSANAWERSGRDDGLLYRGNRLNLAGEWASDEDHAASLGRLPREFLDASVQQELAEHAVARRRARLRVALTGVLAVLVVLALTATGIAVQQARTAAAQARAAAINGLLSQSSAVSDSDPATALRLGMAALSTAPSSQTRAGLIRLMVNSRFAGELEPYPGPVQGLAFTQDGTHVVVGGGDTPSVVWDITTPATPRHVGSLPHPKGMGWHTGATEAVATGTEGGIVLDGNSVWDLTDPAQPIPLVPINFDEDDGERSVWTIAYHAQRRLVLIGGGHPSEGTLGVAGVWNLADPAAPERIGELADHTGPVWTAAFSVDGQTAVTGDDSGAAWLWDLTDPTSPERIGELPGHPGPVWIAEFSKRGELLVTGSNAGAAMLWDVRDPADPEHLATLTGHVGNVWAVAFSPDGDRLVTATVSDREAVVWDTSTPSQPRRLDALTHSSPISEVAYSPTGELILTASTDGTTRMWSAANPAQPRRVQAAPEGAISFDHSGTLAASTTSRYLHESPGVLLWQADADGSFHEVSRLRGRLVGLARDGGIAVTYEPPGDDPQADGDSGAAAIWLLRDPSAPVRAVTIPGRSFRLSPDGTLLSATSGESGDWLGRGADAVLLDITDPERPRQRGTITIREEESWASDLWFSPDNRFLADPGNWVRADPGTHETQLWDISNLDQPRRLRTVPGTTIAFHPHAPLLMAGSSEAATVLWDLSEPSDITQTAVLDGHLGRFSQNGHLAFTRGERSTHIWDVTYADDPQWLITIDGPVGTMFTRDDRELRASLPAGTKRSPVILDVAPLAEIVADPLGYACAITGRGLSEPEWEEYAPALDYRETCVGRIR